MVVSTALIVACNGGSFSGSAIGQLEGRVIAYGEVKQGNIDQAGSSEGWTFNGRAGQVVSILLRSRVDPADSNDPGVQSSLDPLVILGAPSGRIEAQNDDWQPQVNSDSYIHMVCIMIALVEQMVDRPMVRQPAARRTRRY